MGMLCYKNGSLAREYVRDQLPGATPSWDTFNKAVTSESIPQPDQLESDFTFGFYYPKQEIIPRGVHGFYHVKQDQQGQLTLAEASDVKQAGKTIHWSAADARRILESQFLSFKSRIQQLLPEESRQRGLERIYVAGGASANPVIVQLLSTILNGPVYTTSDGTTQGCAVGGAYRAAWAWHCLHAQTNGSEVLGFGDFINEMTGHQKGGVSLAEGKVLARPDAEQAKRYDELLPSWQKAEQLVIDHCRTSN
ncbi:hypothetical protein QFC22_004225 [Naganishia vaughanmartiniae]|uniref:Uncharacterized protein n=1 Tax=Naganishia vaughanmartiniae TaxID=1424756 RepID=A0ACC2X2N3_9TREE|nr:hypothetical protein QFC22_004225 [Naganishia vaughanmartiniae]